MGVTRPLTVVSVAYPFAPVSADPAGGAEQVLAQLDRRLVADGHRSIVIAAAGSSCAGELVPVAVEQGEITDAVRTAVHTRVRAALEEVIARERVDLVHCHGIDFDAYLPDPGVRVLVTLHLPLSWYPPATLSPARPDTYLLPVSASQARGAPVGARLLEPIGNGVDVDSFGPAARKGGFALMLGRVAPEKGFATAIDAAKRAGSALVVAGQVYPYAAHQRYFDEEVVPRLDSERRWIGPVAGVAKRRLLGQARCLLVPSTAPETSSLVAMEALASGTPVIAFRSGALPDIVEDGVTGVLVDDMEGMAAALGRIDEIDPAICRRVACERFSLTQTSGAYLDLYRRLAA
jgi:glycosyltransferase involved in cell wall biosynthesis